jgi:hypothetical protein
MTDEDAQQVANNFKELIAAYSDDLANAVLTEDFVDFSDSVNELINNGCPNGPAPVSVADCDQFASLADHRESSAPRPSPVVQTSRPARALSLPFHSNS